MSSYFNPEYLFIQDNILFIANDKLTKKLETLIDFSTNISSYDFPTLWELKEDETTNELLLHIDFEAELITVLFNEVEINLLIKEKELEALGILIDFNPEQNEAENILFITGIGEGLNSLLFA